ILVYKASKPLMMIESKEMNKPLTETDLRQILNYTISVQADFMIITNGTANYGFAIINGKANPLDQLPNY
ncbi:MAG: type I restriction enzyme HsdR N-terminal domain-containing protein, partial [Sediminibacterium sp.]|nr:type I restriction enzyme HsdR N-terminal domain-containing protein [Sediminibacterium sp.]